MSSDNRDVVEYLSILGEKLDNILREIKKAREVLEQISRNTRG